MKLLKVIAFVLLAYSASAQTLKTPTKSPSQSVKQEFALSSIELDYSRPSARGRKVMGDLVPFGKLWRTGANAQTTIKFGDDVKVNGVDLKAGKYSILTIPGEKEWEFLFCTPETSVFNFKEENVVAKVKTEAVTMPMFFETLHMVFGDQSDSAIELALMWENTMVLLNITCDIDSKVMANIDKVMSADNRPYQAAAAYYFDNGKDLNKALEWVNKAAMAQPEAFWVTHLKAKIQAKMGDKAGAIATATQSLNKAKEAGNGDYVALNEKLIKTLR